MRDQYEYHRCTTPADQVQLYPGHVMFQHPRWRTGRGIRSDGLRYGCEFHVERYGCNQRLRLDLPVVLWTHWRSVPYSFGHSNNASGYRRDVQYGLYSCYYLSEFSNYLLFAGTEH